jgi:hypothetical protein
MALRPDPLLQCFIGAPFELYDICNCPVKDVCDSCGALVVYSADMYEYAQAVAVQADKKVVVICHKCSHPWLLTYVAGKAAFMAAPDSLHDILLQPQIDLAKEMYDLRN